MEAWQSFVIAPQLPLVKQLLIVYWQTSTLVGNAQQFDFSVSALQHTLPWEIVILHVSAANVCSQSSSAVWQTSELQSLQV